LAGALATAIREQFGADLVLATGPAPKTTDSAPEATETPQIALALADRRGTTVKTVPYTGHNAILRPRAAKQGLNLLRLKLLHTRSENAS
jgi:hypothetical protein